MVMSFLESNNPTYITRSVPKGLDSCYFQKMATITDVVFLVVLV